MKRVGLVGSLTVVHWSDEWMNGYMRVQMKMVGLVGSLTVVDWSDEWMEESVDEDGRAGRVPDSSTLVR